MTIWLWEAEGARQVRLGGSTVFSEEQAHLPGFSEQKMAELMTYLQEHQFPVDLATAPDARGHELWQSLSEGSQRVAIRYAVPLRAGREFLGVMTLSEHWLREPLTLEDLNFLKIIADQTYEFTQSPVGATSGPGATARSIADVIGVLCA